MKIRSLLLALACAGLSALAHADQRPDGPPAGNGPRHEIPAEAYKSCKGKREGQLVSVKHDGHEMKGVCKKMQDGRLAMVPDGRPERDGEPPRH